MLLLKCDFCNDKYSSALRRPWGSNFCTQECFKLFNRQVQDISARLDTIFERTYEGKPE